MKIFRFKKLAQAPAIVSELLAAVGSADPRIDIRLTAAITKDLERKGETNLSPEVGASAPTPEIDLSADLKVELIREFGRHGTGLILLEVDRPGIDPES